jgi:type 1 glutamine amidotransferase
VFVSTVGHRLDDLKEPRIRRLTGRGLLWAARDAR